MITQPEFLNIKEEAPSVAALYLFKQDIITELGDCKVLFNEVSCFTTLFSIARINTFAQLCSRNAKGQQSLLQAVDELFWKQRDKREVNPNKKAILKLFLKLYDEDMVEEENFYAWYETAEQRMREIAADFIQWLRTAEESSGEEQQTSI